MNTCSAIYAPTFRNGGGVPRRSGLRCSTQPAPRCSLSHTVSRQSQPLSAARRAPRRSTAAFKMNPPSPLRSLICSMPASPAFAGPAPHLRGRYRKEHTLALLADDAGNVLPGLNPMRRPTHPASRRQRMSSAGLRRRVLGLVRPIRRFLLFQISLHVWRRISPGAYLSGASAAPLRRPSWATEPTYLTSVVIDLHQAPRRSQSLAA